MFAIKGGLLTLQAASGKRSSCLEANEVLPLKKCNLCKKIKKLKKKIEAKTSLDIMENRLPFQLSFYLFCILTSNTPCNLIFSAFDVAVET